VDAVIHLMPEDATYIFTQAQSRRALPARKIYEKFISSGRDSSRVHVRENVTEALELARSIAAKSMEENPQSRPLIYVGGSTYVVSEAVTL